MQSKQVACWTQHHKLQAKGLEYSEALNEEHKLHGTALHYLQINKGTNTGLGQMHKQPHSKAIFSNINAETGGEKHRPNTPQCSNQSQKRKPNKTEPNRSKQKTCE